jgi:hypothetical protein
MRAVRALRLLRDATRDGGLLRGDDFDLLIRRAMPRRTSNLNWPTDLIGMLVRAHLALAHFADDETLLTPDHFERALLEHSLKDFAFSIAAHFGDLCRALGISSFAELEKRADLRSISITPDFNIVQQTAPLRRDLLALVPAGVLAGQIYREAIVPVAQEYDLTVGRVDDLFAARDCLTTIWASIYASDLIVAVCAERDPAVFYELGMAHTVGKPTILLAQTIEDIPYNIRYQHYILYNEAAYGHLRQELGAVIDQIRREERDASLVR